MSKESKHDDAEQRRLEALRRYNVLDTPPEQAFDDLARLAAEICGTPSALVSLVDEDRQWFKSRWNFETRETPRSVSFCAHTIQGNELLEIPDTTQDDRFRDNPLVTGPDTLLYYAGAPLTTTDGHRIGALCVLDQKPGRLTNEQKLALQILARQVTSQIELRHVLTEMSRAQQNLHEQMQARVALESAQQLAERFMRATIDALLDNVAIVDRFGEIVHVNRSWTKFTEKNGGPELRRKTGVGVNYLTVCDNAARRGSAQGAVVATALREILACNTETFELEYPCHAPNERRWFIVRVSAFGKDVDRHAVITHRNITSRHEAQQAITELNESLESRVAQRTLELQRTTDDLRASELRTRNSEAQLRALTTRLQQVREDERSAISREIHDQLGQMLTAVKIDVSLMLQDFRSDAPPAAESTIAALESLQHLLDATVESVRGIARQLRPEVLDALGLAAAIEWHAEEVQERSGIECRVQSSAAQPRLNPEQRGALFRIVQESLTNVVRHSGASKVNIDLNYDNDLLQLTIEDNGNGVDPAALLGTKSLGVVGMRERAATIGAGFDITGHAGKGTCITVRLGGDKISAGNRE